jgi:beta-lactamase class A
MFWRKNLILLLLFLSATVAQGELNPTGQKTLSEKLQKLIATQEARVAVTVIDLKSERQISFNGSTPLPAASVVKLPVMAAAFHLADQGNLDLQQRLTVLDSDKLEGAGVLRWMKAGQSYTLWNLIRLMITLSDNTATRLVVNALGMQELAAYLKGIGLAQTRISDPTMLVEPPADNNNLTSTDDMAKLLVQIYNRRGFSTKSAKQMIFWLNYQRYRWGIWRGVPSGTYVANKTGNLTGILNDVGLVYSPKGVYALAVMTEGFASNTRARLFINEVSRIVYEGYTGEKVLRAKPTATKKKKKITKRR